MHSWVRELLSFSLLSLSAVFFVVDPMGALPVFVAMTQRDTDEKREQMARRASITAFVILTLFAVAGTVIFRLLGVTLRSLRYRLQKHAMESGDSGEPSSGSLEASENRLPFRVCDFTIAWPIVGRIQRGGDGFAEEATQLDLLPISDMQNKLKNGMLPRPLRT